MFSGKTFSSWFIATAIGMHEHEAGHRLNATVVLMLLVGAASSPPGCFDLTAGGQAPEYTKNTNKNTSPFRITFSSPACRDLEQLPRNQSTRPIANKDEEEDGSDERHPRPVMAMTVVDILHSTQARVWLSR